MGFLKKSLLAVSIMLFPVPGLFAQGSGTLGNQAGISTKVTAHGFAFAGVADDPSAIFLHRFSSYSQDGKFKTFINVVSVGLTHKWGG